MTRNEANELRIKHCNLPLLEGPLYDPDNEDKNVVNVLPNSKLLKVMDVGFVLPKTGFNSCMFESYFMTSDFGQSYDTINLENTYNPAIPEAMCIMSTESKKSIFSKRKFNFVGEDIVLFGMVYRNELYIWKEGLIKFKNGRVDKGFELSILNKNLQIEHRAYYFNLVHINLIKEKFKMELEELKNMSIENLIKLSSDSVIDFISSFLKTNKNVVRKQYEQLDNYTNIKYYRMY